MSKVYVVQQHMNRDRSTGGLIPHDYSSAEKFGNIVYLVPSRQIVEDDFGGDVERLLKEKLENSSPDDFLLPSGDPILCAQAVLAFANSLDASDKRLKMLKWDRHQGSYVPVEITIPF